MRRLVFATLCLIAALGVGACGGSSGPDGSEASTATTTSAPPTTVVPVLREVLASDVGPPGAPDRTLTLVRYTIAPGAQLPAHIHPGIQLASIDSGSLSYTIVTGTATVTRGPGGPPESVTGPTTITLGPGDAVAEKGDMVHFGANHTDAPVVILATLLTESGLELAVPVTTTTSIPG
jgi:quercetin dioxygenase-like cupin family protein